MPLCNLLSCGFIIYFLFLSSFCALLPCDVMTSLVFILYLDTFLFCICVSVTGFWFLIIMRSIYKTHGMLLRFACYPCTGTMFIFSLPFQFSKCAVESSTKGLLTLILSERCETQNSELGNCFYFKSHHFLRFSVLRRQQLCIFGQILVTLCNN